MNNERKKQHTERLRNQSDRSLILPKIRRFQKRRISRRRSRKSRSSATSQESGPSSAEGSFSTQSAGNDSSRQLSFDLTEEAEETLSEVLGRRLSPIPSPVPDTRDSDYDTDLENEEKVEPFDSTGRNVYITACKNHDVVPSTHVLKNLPGHSLKLNYQGLSPTDTLVVCIPLLVNTTVTELMLSDNRIGKVGMSYIKAMLKENVNISVLDLANNGLGSRGAQLICEALDMNGTIRVLNLSGNGFIDSDARYIADALKTCHLKKLNLSHNNFREEGGHILGPAIGENDILVELDLSWNHLRLRGAKAIANGIKENVVLKRIDLSMNGFSNDGCLAISKALLENRVLRELDLSSNRITLEGIQYLCKGLLRNETLVKLKLSRNTVGTNGARALLEAVKKHHTSHLQCIEIMDTYIDQTIDSLIQQVKELKPGFDVKHGARVRFADPYNKPIRTHDAWLGDPLTLLLRYMADRNMRLMDLFSQFDTDSSWTLTIDEFKRGVKQAHIPLSELQLEQLVARLDKDKNGEIDFKEMLSGHKKHRDRERRIRQEQREMEFLRSGSVPSSQGASRPSSSRSSHADSVGAKSKKMIPLSVPLGEQSIIIPSPPTMGKESDADDNSTSSNRAATLPEIRIKTPKTKQDRLISRLERLKTS